jgi:YVTN family beta-propeller protein
MRNAVLHIFVNFGRLGWWHAMYDFRLQPFREIEMLSLRMMIANALGVVVLATSAQAARLQEAKADSTFAIIDQWHLGGSGGWDYLTVDGRGTRLFLSRATHVDVVDTQTGKIVGTIPNTNGVHGIALAEDLRRGYASNGKGDSVTVFDLDTLKTVKEAPVSGHNPDAILFDPVGKHIFTFNGRSKDVTVLDASTFATVATLPVPDKPEFAVDDGDGHIFANIESEQGQMVVIDSRKLAVTATWNLPGCASPSGLAIDKSHHRLFSVCEDKVMVITDSVTGKQVAKLPIGEGSDAAAYDARRGLVFSSNGDGTLTVIRQETPDKYRVIQSVATKHGARTMALDSSSGKVYLVTADFEAAPAATAQQPHPRPAPTPDTFTVLVAGSP